MVRLRRLQRRDGKGQWYNDSYVIEQPSGEIEFRYNLTWEHIGGQYAYKIQHSGLPLEQVEQILYAPKLRWLPAEDLDLTYEQAMDLLDEECHIPRLKKNVAAPAL